MARSYSAHTDEPTHSGEGITFTTEPKARLWAVVVPFPGRPAMRCTIRAMNERQAVQFAVARHPGADAERIQVLSKQDARGLL